LQKFLENLYEVLENSVSGSKAKTLALSGGLDSSILAFFLKNKGVNALALTTRDFIATDLTYCQLVAKKFNLPLDIIMPKTEELLSSIHETIKILKNFNDIEIRNSIVVYLLLKSVKDSGKSNIILGDGADELFAGYNFFLKKNDIELQKDLERIWSIMHFPSKIIGKVLGITVETPFLNDNVMSLAKRIPVNFKVGEYNGKKYGKWILRKAFEDKLPKSIVWREKSPMQDGAGTTALTHLFDTVISDKIFELKTKQIKDSDNVKLRTKESLHYYEIYRKYFETPEKLHDSKNKCPNCQYEVKQSSKFCRMCGSFPI
jgi:asparagine synthase (glutamine-hydrolysing)